MTAAVCALPGCGRPVPDQAYICPGCGARLERDLGDVPALAAELVTTWARQSRTGDHGGHSRRAVEPLPYDWAAAHDASTLANAIATWARHVAEQRGLTAADHRRARDDLEPGPTCPACAHGSCARIAGQRAQLAALRARLIPEVPDTPQAIAAAAARWLLAGRHVEWLRHRLEGVEAFDELQHAVAVARRAIDRDQPRWYAGQCGADLDAPDCPDCGQVHLAERVIAAVFGEPEAARCQAELYARPGAATIRCHECGAAHDTADRQAWLLDSARDVLAHAELIGRAATALGKPITPAMVRGYARPERRLVVARGVDGAGRELYRVGDVLDVYDRIQAERERRPPRPARTAPAGAA